VLSATALLVMKSFHLMPRIRLWHVMWNACSLRESSFNSVQCHNGGAKYKGVVEIFDQHAAISRKGY